MTILLIIAFLLVEYFGMKWAYRWSQGCEPSTQSWLTLLWPVTIIFALVYE